MKTLTVFVVIGACTVGAQTDSSDKIDSYSSSYRLWDYLLPLRTRGDSYPSVNSFLSTLTYPLDFAPFYTAARIPIKDSAALSRPELKVSTDKDTLSAQNDIKVEIPVQALLGQKLVVHLVNILGHPSEQSDLEQESDKNIVNINDLTSPSPYPLHREQRKMEVLGLQQREKSTSLRQEATANANANSSVTGNHSRSEIFGKTNHSSSVTRNHSRSETLGKTNHSTGGKPEESLEAAKFIELEERHPDIQHLLISVPLKCPDGKEEAPDGSCRTVFRAKDSAEKKKKTQDFEENQAGEPMSEASSPSTEPSKGVNRTSEKGRNPPPFIQLPGKVGSKKFAISSLVSEDNDLIAVENVN